MKFWQLFLIFMVVELSIGLAAGPGAVLVCGVLFVIVMFVHSEVQRLKPPHSQEKNQEQEEKIKDYWGTID